MKQKYIIRKLTSRLFTSLMIGMLLTIGFSANAENLQGVTVTGKVIASLDGEGLPGVNVVLKGSQVGTITDISGNYSLEVEGENPILVFSYVGYNAEEIEVGSRSVIDIELTEDITALSEVVVTALGIKREERSLGYSVERVKGEEFTRVTNENFLNSMAGKVAGVTINSTGTAGSSVSIVIRGATSLSTDNQPLFIVDGVPIASTINNVGGSGNRNEVDFGNAISDLDPESIESVTILKGPSAAALYGTRAGNGVVIITTKRAKEGQGMKVSISSNTVFDIPSRFFNTDSRFATGFFSFRPENVGGGVLPEVSTSDGVATGPELDRGYWALQWDAPLDANGERIPTELISYPDNVKNFLNDYAFSTINSASVSNSTKDLNYRLGFTNLTSSGLIPNSDLFRNSFSVAVSSKLWDKLTISTNINFNKSWSNNRPAGSRGTNPLQWAYFLPPNIDIQKLKDYGSGNNVKRVSPDYQNPYFLANEVNNSFTRYRVYGNLVANWEISPSFSLMGRYMLNKSDEIQETKIAPGYTREPNNGTYGIADSKFLETNIEVMGTYKKDWENFTLSVSAGGNLLYQAGSRISNEAKSGSGLIVPNVFTVQNISAGSLLYRNSRSEKAINSIYGIANLSWKNIMYLDLTARNDWSSSLPAANRSYFYPSASYSFLINEVFEMRNLDMLKLRAGWAQVGNDTGPYRLVNTYGDAGQWGEATRLTKASGLLAPNLRSETATSLEIGTDIKMFNNRLRFEGTYYTTDNIDQILSIPLAASSGFSGIQINAGLMQSRGWEILIGGTPIRTNNWTWDLDMNFTTNETVIKELPDDVDFVNFWNSEKVRSIGYVEGYQSDVVDNGQPQDGVVGNMYGNKIRRVKDESSPYYNYPILKGPGLAASWDVEDELTKIGNYNPDFILGLQSVLTYKRFSLNMTIDWRSGGQYVSGTWRRFVDGQINKDWLDQMVNPGELAGGPSPELKQWVLDNADRLLLGEKLRPVGGPTPESGGFPESYSGVEVIDAVFIPGVIIDENGEYIENLGEDGTEFIPIAASYPWDVSTTNMFDADYVKLREISLSYRLPSTVANRIGMQDVNISIYSRNIMLWTKDSNFGIDPERAFKPSGNGFSQGIEFYNANPWVLPIGFKLGFTF